MTRCLDIHGLITALDLPVDSRVDQRVPKKMLLENGAPTTADKRQINEGYRGISVAGDSQADDHRCSRIPGRHSGISGNSGSSAHAPGRGKDGAAGRASASGCALSGTALD